MQKLTILKYKILQSTENFEHFVWGGGTDFISQCRNLCEVNYNFVLVSKNLRGELQFYLTVPKILPGTSCTPNFLNFAAVFLLKVIFCDYFDL